MLKALKRGKYRVGQRWGYRARPGEEASLLTIVRVESSPKLGVVVHVSLEGVRIKSAQAPSGFVDAIAHMPFAESAIDRSVTHLVSSDASLPDFEAGYREWRRAIKAKAGGIFSITVAEGVEFVESTLNG